ncbi:MAG TPA: divalent-cation tolerance protein CutA [Candidatus Paceibacterota bacterium]|nr:divalent-cation tolerance protein CutA [Candidatus Paceibacterota bacterium]
MTAQRFKIVLVTAPDLKTARKLARKALESRLVACANLIPKIESLYRWRGKIESSSELLIVFKTTAKHLKSLEKLVINEHPYDTPEFLVLPISAGNRRYLNWLAASCLG